MRKRVAPPGGTDFLVLQRVGTHPASQVELLTPRLWKEHFAGDPLRSDLDRLVKNAGS